MNLNIRIALLVICLAIFSAQGQEDKAQDSIGTRSNMVLYFDFGVVIAPQAIGDNFIAKGYNLKSGFDFGTTIKTKYFTVHGNILIHGGKVTDKDIVGNFNSTSFSRYSFGLGYSFKVNDKISIDPSVNYGYLLLSSRKAGIRRFKDDGNFFSVDVQVNYQLTETFSLYAGVTGFTDNLKVETPTAIQDFYDSSGAIYPAIGIRFNTFQRKRIAGEPGDGIFTRRDGL